MSSGTNYPAGLDLWVNKAAGDEVSPTEINQVRSAIEQIQRKLFPIPGYNTELTVSNTTSEATIQQFTVPANALGTQGCVEGTCNLLINSILAGSSLFLKFYWGGTLFWTPNIFNGSGSMLTGIGLVISFHIHNRNDSGQQALVMAYQLPISMGTSNNDCIVTGGAKNTTAIQTWQLNAQWSSASASNSVSGVGLFGQGRTLL